MDACINNLFCSADIEITGIVIIGRSCEIKLVSNDKKKRTGLNYCREW